MASGHVGIYSNGKFAGTVGLYGTLNECLQQERDIIVNMKEVLSDFDLAFRTFIEYGEDNEEYLVIKEGDFEKVAEYEKQEAAV